MKGIKSLRKCTTLFILGNDCYYNTINECHLQKDGIEDYIKFLDNRFN